MDKSCATEAGAFRAIATQLQAQAATFDAPFEMLHACHERVHRTLELMEKLRKHVSDHGADAQARQAAHDVIRYFDHAAPQHHRDEEDHVFPALLAEGDAAMAALVARLKRDHLAMETLWVAARRVLRDVEAGHIRRLTARHEADLAAFAVLYPAHITAEEQIAYPAAEAFLDGAAQAAMGLEMMRRRGAR